MGSLRLYYIYQHLCLITPQVILVEERLLHMYTYDVLPSSKVTRFPFLGRVYHSQTTMKDSTFESKAYGKRVNKVIAIEGRVQFDLLQVSKVGVLHCQEEVSGNTL